MPPRPSLFVRLPSGGTSASFRRSQSSVAPAAAVRPPPVSSQRTTPAAEAAALGSRLSHSWGGAGQGHTLVRVPSAVAAEVAEAQFRVWGTVVGTGERSGRKWLRRRLRGPGVRSWNGVNFRELLPDFITPLKEDFFRAEQALNRLGKTRITGKVKSPLKPLADTLAFEDAVEEALDDVELLSDSEALLTPAEVEERDALLEAARSPSEARTVSALYERLEADREQRREHWEGVMANAGGANTSGGAAGGKAPRKGQTSTFRFRQGFDDKAGWGAAGRGAGASGAPGAGGAQRRTYPLGSPLRGDTPPPSPVAGSGAGAVAGGGEGDGTIVAAAGGATGAEEMAVAGGGGGGGDVFDALASTMSFSINPDTLSPEEVDSQYEAYVKRRAAAEWAALSAAKDDAVFGVMMGDLERTLEACEQPKTPEGLAALYLSDPAEKAAALAAAREAVAAQGRGGERKKSKRRH